MVISQFRTHLGTVVSHGYRDLTRYTPLPWYRLTFEYQPGCPEPLKEPVMETAIIMSTSRLRGLFYRIVRYCD